MSTQDPSQADLWLFGYGSLIWRPDFEHAERVVACAEGWVRRFFQGSVDHRGVPGAPGRVVTLLPRADGHCIGMAFRVPAGRAAAVLERLDVREVGGYERIELGVRLQAPDGPRRSAITYVATERNANFLGEAPMAEMAAQVLGACGPSGPNTEYVLRLDEWLRDGGHADPHVHELASLVRRGVEHAGVSAAGGAHDSAARARDELDVGDGGGDHD